MSCLQLQFIWPPPVTSSAWPPLQVSNYFLSNFFCCFPIVLSDYFLVLYHRSSCWFSLPSHLVAMNGLFKLLIQVCEVLREESTCQATGWGGGGLKKHRHIKEVGRQLIFYSSKLLTTPAIYTTEWSVPKHCHNWQLHSGVWKWSSMTLRSCTLYSALSSVD